jgi:hypothetical protein
MTMFKMVGFEEKRGVTAVKNDDGTFTELIVGPMECHMSLIGDSGRPFDVKVSEKDWNDIVVPILCEVPEVHPSQV